MKKVFFNFLLFDGLSEELQHGKAIIVHNGKIENIAALDQIPVEQYDKVDLKGYTLIPGLIDLHVHITSPLLTEFKGKDDFQAMKIQRELNFRSCIRYGITTVRDMGAFPDCIQGWKKKIGSGKAVGPRIYTPNSFITSRNGPPERAPHVPFPISVLFGGQLAERVSTPKEVIRAAKKNIRKGADFLKTQYAESSMFFQPNMINLSDECFEAIRKAALENNMKVAMHHTDNAGFRKGIEFGFNCLEHCSLEPLDEADIEEFIAQNMAIVPTLRVNHSCFEIDEIINWLHGQGKADYSPIVLNQLLRNLQLHKEKPYPPESNGIYLDIEKSRRGFENTLNNVNRLKNAGALIGVGSDSFGCYLNLPGFLWKELQLLTRAGFSNFEVLRAATIVNAEILGVKKELGSIEPGKHADFAVIEGNPLEDITCIKNIRLVVKDGISYN